MFLICLYSLPGLCCVFASNDSYNYVETYLEKTVGQSDDILREDVPIVLVLAQDPKEKDSQQELKSKAQELVNRYMREKITNNLKYYCLSLFLRPWLSYSHPVCVTVYKKTQKMLSVFR